MATCILLQNIIIEDKREELEFDATISAAIHESIPDHPLDSVSLNESIQQYQDIQSALLHFP
jgi:hypothetical protein